jgi:hypothetical protein
VLNAFLAIHYDSVDFLVRYLDDPTILSRRTCLEARGGWTHHCHIEWIDRNVGKSRTNATSTKWNFFSLARVTGSSIPELSTFHHPLAMQSETSWADPWLVYVMVVHPAIMSTTRISQTVRMLRPDA